MWRNKFLGIILVILFFFRFALSEDEIIYDPKNRRDPFIPLVSPEGRLLKFEEETRQTKLNLEGIIYSKTGLSYAIINGEVLKVGDRIAEYDILKIEKDRIILIKEGQLAQLILKEEVE